MLETTALPQPSPGAMAVSNELSARIAGRIDAAGGCIGFDDYMRMALYEPGLGYYLAGAVKFGVDGDFVTAPELSPLFGACIARQCQDIIGETGGGIFEFGAGSGALAAGVLAELVANRTLPESYTILELSPALRERQLRTIETRAPGALERVKWVERVPEAPFCGVVLANEIVDAFPVKVVRLSDGRILERQVKTSGDNFQWEDVAADDGLTGFIHQRVPSEILYTHEDYTLEVNVGIDPWVADLARMLQRGISLIIDYGSPRSEHLHPQRTAGTLMCHFRHRAHDDPFYLPGLQDITASVDFTSVAEAAVANGMDVLGFAEQASFLLASGLLDDAAQRGQAADAVTRHKLAYETKVLTMPTEMGSRFKVLALGKGYNAPLRGFQLRDDRHRL